MPLHILERFVEGRDARLQLVDGIVQRLDLSGDAVHLGGGRVALRFDRLRQGVHRGGHFVHTVGGLLDQMLQNAHALGIGLLHLLQTVLELLHLGLELDHLLGGRVGVGSSEKHRQEGESGGRWQARGCFGHQS